MPKPSRFSDSHGLILALDVSSLEQAVDLLRTVKTHIDGIKIGWQLLLRAGIGLDLFAAIQREFDGPMLVDTKIQDVSHIAIETIGALTERGVHAVTTWASVGEKVIVDCREAFPTVELFALTGLTSGTYDDAESSVLDGVKTVVASGSQHLQVPGNFPALVGLARAAVGSAACIVCCGMGAQGGEIGAAITAGADFEIVGRDIYKALDPAAIAASYRSRIEAAWRSRSQTASVASVSTWSPESLPWNSEPAQ